MKILKEEIESLIRTEVYAIRLSLGSEITFIWGPPGTGKSQTLSAVAEELIRKNKTVLLAAHTNQAVDGLLEKVIGFCERAELEYGKVIRWRVTESEKLVHLTPAAIIKEKEEKYKAELFQLENEEALLNEQLINFHQ